MRKAKGKTEPVGTVASGAVPAEALEQSFPSIRLPIHPPYPPAEAKSVAEIPSGEGWLYEPKWDGFRCLAFRSGDQVLLQSKAGQPLGRYFPELVTALRKLPHSRFVVDSEIVIYSGEQLAFDDPYRSGERTAMVKIKRIRTADCVVGGFRYAEKGGGIGSLLLGLYNEQGQLDHVGFTSSFNAAQRRELKKIVKPLIGPPGFTGRAPGGPSRWSTRRSAEWQPLKAKLVCEVQYDHFSGGRFRHGTKFLRWRPEKKPRQCTFEQVRPPKRHAKSLTFELPRAIAS